MFVRFAITAASVLLLAACGEPEQEPTPGGVAAPEPPSEQTPPAAIAPAAEQPAPPSLPDSIVAQRGGFVPEGVEYDAKRMRFLVGSIREGTIFQVGNDGAVTPAITDPELKSSVGIEVDEARDRLIVANADGAVFQPDGGKGQAKIAVYDLSNGARLAMIDVGTSIVPSPPDLVHFVNDVAVAADGTIYATDTRAGVVYRVDTEYTGSVFVGRDAFMAQPFLNGIEVHPNGYLLVADTMAGTLYKIPIDNPTAPATVSLPEPMTGADGMAWHPDGSLIVVRNGQNRVVALKSDDDWSSARIDRVAMYEGQASTAAVAGSDVYVVQPHFADQEPPMILRMTFQ
jgi:sugar lactone lactonase YvrE